MQKLRPYIVPRLFLFHLLTVYECVRNRAKIAEEGFELVVVFRGKTYILSGNSEIGDRHNTQALPQRLAAPGGANQRIAANVKPTTQNGKTGRG